MIIHIKINNMKNITQPTVNIQQLLLQLQQVAGNDCCWDMSNLVWEFVLLLTELFKSV